VEKIHYERIEREAKFASRRAGANHSEIIPNQEFLFGLTSSQEGGFSDLGLGRKEGLEFSTFKEKARRALEVGREMTGFLLRSREIISSHLQDTFKEERQAIFQKLIQKEFDEHCRFMLIFRQDQAGGRGIVQRGAEIPFEIQVARK